MQMTTGAQVPQQRISPEQRHELETKHGELLREAREQDAAGDSYEAQVTRLWARDIAQKLGMS